MMNRNSTWEFGSSNLGDRSFMELKGGNQFDHVEEIDLSDNEVSTFGFIRSRTLQVLDLHGNNLHKLTLNQKFYPRLLRLNLSGNHI